VVLFTKPPTPGRVKTRLIGRLSAEQAAQLHAAFLVDLLARLHSGPFRLAIAWDLGPGESPALDLLPAGAAQRIESFPQAGRDLGERLERALARCVARHACVAAIGSDHPTLSCSRIEEAFRRLEEGADVALGPAHDGGYYLIAVRSPAFSPRLFADIAWSTSGVLAGTLERCRELGLRAELLREESDVDTGADLEELCRRSGEVMASCPRTAGLLSEWRLLAPGGSEP
jgi:rSAM/selenodomain-associated transferase 1